jgi:hypothetical protein
MIIWNTLIDVYSPHGRSTIISLHCRLYKLCLEKTEAMSTYIARAQEVAGLLSEAGHTLSNDDLLLAITSSLPQSYNPFLISLDTLPDLEYSLDTIIPRLINEYTCQSLTPTAHFQTQTPTPPAKDDAMSASTNTCTCCPISEVTCFKCNQKGHYQHNCPSNKSTTDTASAAESDNDSFWFCLCLFASILFWTFF